MRKVVDLPLHYGKAPYWLMQRMKRLTLVIFEIIASTFSEDEILKRLADPFWIQALGGLLGFDWHSSGLTVTTTSAISYVLTKLSDELKIFPAGGKGKKALKTPEDIYYWADRYSLDFASKLVTLSRLTARVDNNLIQDGYTIYHHFFVFNTKGDWVVIQQGMNTKLRYARRYHWNSFDLKDNRFNLDTIIKRLGASITAFKKYQKVLNLSDEASSDTRRGMLELLKSRDFKKLERVLSFPAREPIIPSLDLSPLGLEKIKLLRYKNPPETFKDLVLQKGVGAKTIRALALASHVIYKTPLCYKDPVTFTYAHGGKDGYPYKIKPKDYDKTVEILHQLSLKLKDKKAKKKAEEFLIKLTEL